MAITRQGMAEQELLRTQTDLKRAMAELKIAQAKARSGTTDEAAEQAATTGEADIERAIQSDPVMRDYFRREEELKGFLANVMRVAQKRSDVAVVAAQGELREHRDRMKRYEARLASTTATGARNPSR